MTMGVGTMPRFEFSGDNKNDIHCSKQPNSSNNARRQRPGNVACQTPPRMARIVKSLVNGRVLHLERPAPPGNNPRNSISNDSSPERVVLIDPKFRRQDKKPEEQSPIYTATISPTSILTSIANCAGVGNIGASFLNEHDEESSFRYDFGGIPCTAGSNDDEYENETKTEKGLDNLIAMFPKKGFPLARSRTSNSVNSTTTDSVLILNSRDNTVTVESIGGGSSTCSSDEPNKHPPNRNPTYDAFSTARKLLFGGFSKATDREKQKNNEGVFCNSNNICEDPNSRTSSRVVESSSSILHWYNEPSPVSTNSGRSLASSSFSPPIAMYAAAYGDDDVPRENVENNLDECSPRSAGGSNNVDNNINDTAHQGGHPQIQYWRKRLQYATSYYGKSHSSTADAYFNLGRVQLDISPGSSSSKPDSKDPFGSFYKAKQTQQEHQYDLAVENLTIALGIWERKHGPSHLSVGRALDALALAIVRRANHDLSKKGRSSSHHKRTAAIGDLRYSKRLLEQAFGIRAHHLGVWHVDTVETYNKLAGVLLHLGLLGEASRAYHEVFLVRRAIFGSKHPSVAITAHSLANCHYKRGNPTESLKWYKVSLEVYESMGLSYRHPAVTKLLKDQSRLEDYMDLDL